MIHDDVVVLLPARMGSSRLPGKPLADIAGRPMILRALDLASRAAVGPVVVATDSPEIIAVVEASGGRAVMTRSDHVSGSDRVHEALGLIDPDGRAGVVVSCPGDHPVFDPSDIRAALFPLTDHEVDISTLAAEISEPAERTDPNVVKAVGTMIAPRRLRALYFTRATAPWGEGPLYHHIGLYAYRRGALERFIALSPSRLERRESLEQLRALEAGMRIDVALVDSVPLGVNTPADLERVRTLVRWI